MVQEPTKETEDLYNEGLKYLMTDDGSNPEKTQEAKDKMIRRLMVVDWRNKADNVDKGVTDVYDLISTSDIDTYNKEIKMILALAQRGRLI